MYTIPKQLITEWDQLKRQLIPSVDKVTVIQPADKRRIKAQLTGLFDQFDQGPKAKMKLAANARTDAEARKAAKVVFDTAAEYSKNLNAAAKSSPAALKTVIEPYFEKVDKLLVKIRQHAYASATSRAPITFHKELDEIVAAFAKSAAEIQSAGKQKYGLDKAQQTSLENYFTDLERKLKPNVLEPKEARTEYDLYVKLGNVRKEIEVYRTKYLPAWWKRQTTMPQSAAELPKRLDKLFVTMGTNIDRLIKELKTALTK